MVITINYIKIRYILKKLFNEKTNSLIGNLSYLTILAIAPTIIIITSLLNILSRYLSPNIFLVFSKIYEISNTLNLNQTTNFFIIIICLNLLSNGIFSLLTNFEDIYKFKFENYVQKKLYSITLSVIFILLIICITILTFLLRKNIFFNKISFIINLSSIFLAILSFLKFSTFQKLKNLYPGALISSLFLTSFLSFFYYIINNFSNLKSYYGLLAPIIISILLIYYSCYIIYAGILINVELSSKKNE